MNSFTISLNSQQINQLLQYYQRDLVTNVPYSQFRAKLAGVTITAYNSGKVLFQGPAITEELQELSKFFSFIPRQFEDNHQNPNLQGNLIGSDEVGNGSYFGALTVCAVYLSIDKIELVKELGVKDSKQLRDFQIREIAQDLKHIVPYSLNICQPEQYNSLISQGYNAVSLKVALHNTNLLNLLSLLTDQNISKIDGIIIDEFTSQNNYYQYLTKEDKHVKNKLTFIQKAESQFLAVAGASIIARDAFLNSLDDLGHQYGNTSLPSGAGPKVDLFASQLVKKYGKNVLNRTAKLHFKNTDKIMNLIR